MKRAIVFLIAIGSILSATLFSESNNIPSLKVSAIKLSETQSPEKYYYGTVNSLGMVKVSYSSREQYHGVIDTIHPMGTSVMSRITDTKGNIVNIQWCDVAAVERNVFEYNLKKKEAKFNAAKAELENAKTKYDRYGKLVKTNSVSQGKYDKSVQNYYSVLSAYEAAAADLIVAHINLNNCTLTTTYSGVINKINFVPGNWTHVDYPVLEVKTMTPIGVELKMNKTLSEKIFKRSPKRVYPVDSDSPMGTLNEFERLTDEGLNLIVDNYGVQTNENKDDGKYPVVESYWGVFYVSRFYSALDKITPLAVPVESLRKDEKGYYVWRGKGQKVCQPDVVIADKFQIEKVYVIPGEYKTYINGPCEEYQMLEDSGTLKEYDFILGKLIPDNLKENDTVVYKKYKYLFYPGEVVKVEIPDLTKPGFYIPSSYVAQKATGDCYVYINDNGKAKLEKIRLTGGTDKYYRIEGNNIRKGTEILALNDNISNGISVETVSAPANENTSVDVSAIKLENTALPDSEKGFYATVDSLITSSIKYTTWTDYAAEVLTVSPVGEYVMSQVTDSKGNIVNADMCGVTKIARDVFVYNLKSKEAKEAETKVALNNAKIKYDRYKTLFDKKAASKEKYEDALVNYLKAQSDYQTAEADKLDALNTLNRCSVTSVYSGVVDQISTYPGTWIDIDYPTAMIKIMTPIGLNINLNRYLAEKVYKQYPKKIFPVNSELPVGAYNEYDEFSDNGLTITTDNYLVRRNKVEGEEQYPAIEGYWGLPLYVSNFYAHLHDNTPLSVPVESLRKDERGYYVWRGKGQKVCQPDAVIADKFQVEKVYVVPGEYKTYINCVCKEYQILENAGSLQEYDFILGKKIPANLKDNETVVYKKYGYLFTPGETVRVDIPNLVNPGFYVPASSVIRKATDDYCVYINDGGKAKLVKVKLTGGNDKYYRIEDKNISEGTEILLPDNKNLVDGVKVNVNSVAVLFKEKGKAPVKIDAICLKMESVPESEQSFSGTIRSLDTMSVKFTSKDQVTGYVMSTLPVNAPVLSRITDKNGNIVNKNCVLAKIDSSVFEYHVKEAKEGLAAAKAALDNASIKYERYDKLFKSNAVSKETYDDAVESYYSAESEYYDAKAQLLDAEDTLKKCSVTAVYNGLIDKIYAYPGHWSDIDHELISIKLAIPIGLDIKLNRTLAEQTIKYHLKKIYPVGVSSPIGALNGREQLTDDGMTILLDNYIVPLNQIVDEGKYPVIETYWPILYVSRFNALLDKSAPLSVPVESLRKDERGYYVWRGKGQKVCQPDAVIADKFQVEKVYVVPGEYKTYINGPSVEYQVLNDSGKLEEYDFLLGSKIPENLTDNATVVYKKYKLLFNFGDILKTEIPDLFKPGFYVPASAVIQKATDDCYVYINDNGKARIVKVKLTGGNDKYYRIEGSEIKDNVQVLVLNDSSNGICNGTPVQPNLLSSPFSLGNKEALSVSAVKLEVVEPKGIDRNIYGKIVSLDEPRIAFSTWDGKCGDVISARPAGSIVMSSVSDSKGNIINDNCVLGKVDSKIYAYFVREKEALLLSAEATLENTKTKYERYKKLFEKKAASKEQYDDAIEAYNEALNGYNIALNNLKDARTSLDSCTVTTAYAGIIEKIITYPGSWSDKGNPIAQLNLMTPIGLDIPMNRDIAVKTFRQYPKEVYPSGSDIPVGVLNEQDSLTDDGIRTLVHNYLIPENNIADDNKYPVIESYWGHPLYVSRFYSSLDDKSPLAVPVESLYKDDKGYYVWRGKGQKVCQPDAVIADKFQVEKVYVTPGNLKTYINGVCVEYQALKDAGMLQEYDFVLGKNIPDNLEDNMTVSYKRYKFLFNPGDVVKIEIPDLVAQGFYVPCSSVVQKATDDCYVYINDNGKARLMKVKLTGGNSKYYRIEGNDIKAGAEVLILDNDISKDISNGMPIKVASVAASFNGENMPLDVTVAKLKKMELPDSEKAFTGTVSSLDVAIMKFTNWTQRYGRVYSTLPVGFSVMPKITTSDDNIVNADLCTFAKMEANEYEYILKAKEARFEKTKCLFENARKEYDRYEKLVKSKATPKETYDNMVESYYSAKADYIVSEAEMLIAKENVKVCTRHSPYSGIIDQISAQPGSWSTHSYPILKVDFMSPIGIDLNINRTLAKKILGSSQINVYPSGSDFPIGTFSQQNRLSENGITALVDNYMITENNMVNGYKAIEDYWNPMLYVSRFFTPLKQSYPLAVPVESLHKDDNGYYVWRGKGQKVCQPDAIIADKFEVEKVYVVPGDLKTFVYGPCIEYRILKDASNLQEYDFLLGTRIPANLKNNDTVIYRRHKYLFRPGDKVKVEIPDLFNPGFYVPASSVVQKSTGDCYVFIKNNNKAELVKVALTGGNDKYYRIEGEKIAEGSEVILLNKQLSGEMVDGAAVNVKPAETSIADNVKPVNVSAVKLVSTVPKNTAFYGTVKPADITKIKFSTYQHNLGYINSTHPIGAYRMGQVRNLNDEVVSLGTASEVVSVDNVVYGYVVKSKEADVKNAKAILDNAEIEYQRYKKLAATKAESEEAFDNALKNYESAKAGYAEAKANLLIAKNDYERCSVNTIYPGMIKDIYMLPGAWVSRDWPILNLQIMNPVGINLNMDRILAERLLKNYPIKVYPADSDIPVGCYEASGRLTDDGFFILADNYLVPKTTTENKENYPVVKGYWGQVLYAYRFRSPMRNETPLAVPVEALRKDKEKYFIWKAVGQRVFQPDVAISDTFKIEKVYVTPGDMKTYINGDCAEYQILKDAGNLEIYDVVLGQNIPENLKNGDTVFYMKYGLLFKDGDIVKIEIPELVKPGFYVPVSAVIKKSANDNYVYAISNGKAKLLKVKITGGTDKYYRIEGEGIAENTEIITDSGIVNDGCPVNVAYK